MPMGTGSLGTAGIGGLFAAVTIDAATIDVSTVPLDPVYLTDPTRWTVAPVGLGEPVTVVSVTEEDPQTRWRLSLSPDMSLGALQYSVTFDPTGTPLTMSPGCLTVTVLSPPAAPVYPTPLTALLASDLPFDVANPQLVRDAGIVDPPPLGQYQVDDRGDFALDNRLQNIRKRILRRISTPRGGFFHLPNYGFAQPPKGNVRPSELRKLAADAKAQVEREPEVVRVQVSVQQIPQQPNVVVLAVRARTTLGLDVAANRQIDLRPNLAGG